MILKKDLLRRFGKDISGMSWDKSWTYNGGFGLAGYHAEDGWLDFGHHVFDIQFEVESSLTQRLLSVLGARSRKTWVFSKQRGIEGVFAANKYLAERVGKPDLADGMLMARAFVLDPRVVDAEVFDVVYQHPGEFMFGDSGHSVSGFTLFSMSCNFAINNKLRTYIDYEYAVSRRVREIGEPYIELRSVFNGGARPVIRNFSLLSVLFNYVQFESCLPGEVYASLFSAYKLEQDMLVGMEFKSDLLYDVPQGNLGTICFNCGIGCLSNMFLLDDTLWCVHCIKGNKVACSHARAVPLLSRYQARIMGFL